MKMCDYGCGQEATHQFKNGKWCCSNSLLSCPTIRENQKGKKHPRIGKKHNENSKIKMSLKHLGKSGFWKGKTRTEKTKIKISESLKGNPLLFKTKNNNKTKIEDIIKKYSFFSQIEEMRYNPDKPEEKEIQVHCKNHNCQNSKEQNGWFTPTYTQLYERIRQVENLDGNNGSYLYCSDKCKDECPLYNLKSDPFTTKLEFQYTQEEYITFRQTVLNRDNHICQYCGKLAEHVHHERPQKLEPFFSLDPDLAWSVCSECHYKYGHNDNECKTGVLANKKCL